ncbi:hypothetical protein ACV168_26085, partial [Escherichia coli]
FQKGILALTYQGLFHFIVQQNGCSTPEPFRLAADSTTVFLFRNPSLLHSVLSIPQNIIRLQPLHFSYEKGRRVLSLRPGPGANCHYRSLTPV